MWSSAARGLIRAFGVLNILLGVLGLDNSVRTAVLFAKVYPRPGEPAFHAFAFYTMTGLNVLCIVVLIVGGLALLRVSEKGRVICNVLFTFEIVYLLFVPVIPFFLSFTRGKAAVMAESFIRAGGIGDMGLAPQLVTGYPLIALVAINLAYRRLRRVER